MWTSCPFPTVPNVLQLQGVNSSLNLFPRVDFELDFFVVVFFYLLPELLDVLVNVKECFDLSTEYLSHGGNRSTESIVSSKTWAKIALCQW